MDAFRTELSICAPPHKILAALTEQAGIAGWWTTDSSVEGVGLGARTCVRFGETSKVFVTEKLAPDQELVWRCVASHLVAPGVARPDEWTGTSIAFRWKPLDGERTQLELLHSGLTEQLSCFDLCRSGWQRFLQSLVRYVETGVGEPYSAGPCGAHIPPGERRFETSIEIAAGSEAVWRALTEKAEIERWFATRVRVEARVGGALDWSWGDLHDWRNQILVVEPGQHLRLRYNSTVSDARGELRPLFMDFHLEGQHGTTTLRVAHHGFGPEGDFDAEYDGISAGWPVELTSLRLYLERHAGQARELAWAVRVTEEQPAAVWERLTGPGALGIAEPDRLRPGGPFLMALPGAAPITGRVLAMPGAREFCAQISSLGDGWFRLGCERAGQVTRVWLWLALYEPAARESAGYQKVFEALLERVIPSGSQSPVAVSR